MSGDEIQAHEKGVHMYLEIGGSATAEITGDFGISGGNCLDVWRLDVCPVLSKCMASSALMSWSRVS